MEAFVWTDREVRAALGLSLEAADDDVVYTGVSTDSRALREGELFVALVGESFDGHDFVADALAQGAGAAVVSHPVPGDPEGRFYPVDDTLVALGALASHRRSHLPARRVGITGSSGKTGTKDLLRGALEGSVRVHATRGNLNNRIGLPLTLLGAPPDTEVLVLEMGTNEPGEIAILTEIAAPEIGVLTTVAESHLEKLGSFQGVMDEKLDLLRGLPGDGWAVVGDEPPELPARAREIRADLRVAGWSERADPDLRPMEVEADHWGRIRFRWHGEDVTLHVPGRHAVVNALLALAVADLLEVSPGAAARGVSAVEPGSLRGEIRPVGGLTLILDCYNANPQSVRAALDLLARSPTADPTTGQGTATPPGDPPPDHSPPASGTPADHPAPRGGATPLPPAAVPSARRVAFLGTMLELGERSRALHEEVLADALTRPLDVVVATGAFAEAAATVGAPPPDGPELIAAEEPEEAYAFLRERLEGDEAILLKASRGVALEALVPLLERDFGGGGDENGDDAAGGGAGGGEEA